MTEKAGWVKARQGGGKDGKIPESTPFFQEIPLSLTLSPKGARGSGCAQLDCIRGMAVPGWVSRCA